MHIYIILVDTDMYIHVASGDVSYVILVKKEQLKCRYYDTSRKFEDMGYTRRREESIGSAVSSIHLIGK